MYFLLYIFFFLGGGVISRLFFENLKTFLIRGKRSEKEEREEAKIRGEGE